jgi:ATP-dependent protease ClpP protease subunit
MTVNKFVSSWIWVIATYLVTINLVAAAESEDSRNYFNGRITNENVEKFIAEHPNGTIKKLIITSSGGDGRAGLRFGNWVRQNGLDVQVRFLCASACSNFVFLAGNKKTIEPRALITWHGSIEQKNMRELQSKYGKLLLKEHQTPGSLLAEEAKFLEDNKKKFESIAEFRELQARFHDDVQVNEHITRLGQEPINYGLDSWTVTVKVMEKFGINNVEAPPDYGTLGYLRSTGLALLLNGGKLLTFDLDANGYARRIEDPAQEKKTLPQ